MKSKQINFKEISQIVLEDLATGGRCYNGYLYAGEYIDLVKDVYKKSNDFQRRVINIRKSLIYQKLVKDLLRGVVIPTISLFFNGKNEVTNGMEIDISNIQILDGLQRTNCLIYALKLLSGEIEDDQNILDSDDILSKEDFLSKVIIRVEIWTNLTVNGILYKMVSLNAGQTPMDLNHQFEILELPLKDELKKAHNIEIYTKDEERNRRGNFGFNISNLVEGIIAYNTESIFPKKQSTAISIMNSLDIKKQQHESTFLKSDYLIKDLVWVIDKLHRIQIEKYEREEIRKYKGIFSESDVFFIPFMAALGKARKEIDDSLFEKKKEELIDLLSNGGFDPLNLLAYDAISETYKSNIGQKRRRLVFLTFLMYFRTVGEIDWNMGDNLI
ncbi:hypothetical protein [Peribacillus asahii]|uniref:hypothetical protein n=1 Tax=Peribacillus asahii TaxID=228899 RepID=UPI002079542F|nr:hypothetical protein [Peribacillus asahii]USK86155.1 hypothetical protein LIT35_05805 [Peribacillus asahii]